MLQSVKFTFRSLRYRNYRLFFTGQIISLIGMWLQNVAMGWLIYRLTDSELLLGVVGFAENLPIFLLTPFVGVLVDRWNKHRTLIITQTLCMIQAFILAGLVLSGTITVWHVVILSLVLGTIMAVDMTSRQSFWVELVDNKDDIGNAISLNSTMYNLARLLGPSAAGVAIATIGEGICFLLNAISYIAVVIALCAIKIVKKTQTTVTKKQADFFSGLKEGLGYAWGSIAIRYTLLLLATVSFTGIQYLVMMPVFAKDVLQGGSAAMGYLVGASGLGALIGAIFMASRKNALGLPRTLMTGTGLAGCAFIAFSLSRVLLLSMAAILILAFGLMLVIAGCNIIVQTVVDNDKRGRVMGIHAFCFAGMAPFGNLYLGAAASVFSAPAVFMFSGIVILLITLVYGFKRPAIENLVAQKVAEK
ncbi:MAG: MFS transporter [Peptococcaceae bacterium]|jgi:MFS family permease|nr:MFS transporter [Peptococcaceae bacterium]